MRLFASTIYEIFYVGFIPIELLKIVNILNVFFLYFIQDGFINYRLLRNFLPMNCPSPRVHKKIVFKLDALWTALSDDTDLSRS